MIKILGIETSCDETAVAIVSKDKKILANEVISQIVEHNTFGGVVPEIASRSHLNYLDHLLDKVQKVSNLNFNKIDAIAVTAGPGLIGGLIVGIMYAKAIAASLEKPIIAVNHLEGHALTAMLSSNLTYPFLLLLVSGGHTQFIEILELGKYNKIGSSLDDAVGEAFDKVSKMLGLDYPGGPIIEIKAQTGNNKRFKLPMPLCNNDYLNSCDFSFSGLKTAVKRLIDENLNNLNDSIINDICASFQYTVCEILKYKVTKAIMLYSQKNHDKTFVLSGGVAANQYIRAELHKLCIEKNFTFYAPPINLCGDNAAMIAWVGIQRYQKNLFSDLNFAPYSRQDL